jgi:hypothetical protein
MTRPCSAKRSLLLRQIVVRRLWYGNRRSSPVRAMCFSLNNWPGVQQKTDALDVGPVRQRLNRRPSVFLE